MFIIQVCGWVLQASFCGVCSFHASRGVLTIHQEDIFPRARHIVDPEVLGSILTEGLFTVGIVTFSCILGVSAKILVYILNLSAFACFESGDKTELRCFSDQMITFENFEQTNVADLQFCMRPLLHSSIKQPHEAFMKRLPQKRRQEVLLGVVTSYSRMLLDHRIDEAMKKIPSWLEEAPQNVGTTKLVARIASDFVLDGKTTHKATRVSTLSTSLCFSTFDICWVQSPWEEQLDNVPTCRYSATPLQRQSMTSKNWKRPDLSRPWARLLFRSILKPQASQPWSCQVWNMDHQMTITTFQDPSFVEFVLYKLKMLSSKSDFSLFLCVNL